MSQRHAAKLTPAEAKRLEQYIDNRGGQIKASILFGVAPATLSRNINRHTAPSPMLRDKLIGAGVIKQQPLKQS